MAKSITVIGSTGLIGKQFLQNIEADDFQQVTAITRRKILDLQKKTFIKQVIHDFSDLESMRSDLRTDVLICTLGTTIKIAGSQKRFYEVDHDIPLKLAKIAFEEGCRTFILVSSIGANASSGTFYLRVKGQLEEDLKEIGFTSLQILRPGMLLGSRQESRPGEFIGKIIMKPLSFLIPWQYKPIEATTVATKINQLIKDDVQGEMTWSGKPLFQTF